VPRATLLVDVNLSVNFKDTSLVVLADPPNLVGTQIRDEHLSVVLQRLVRVRGAFESRERDYTGCEGLLDELLRVIGVRLNK
jgi:hypothetical protein